MHSDMLSTMKIVDLFCGAGGFSLGAHKAGFQVTAAFDVDPVLTSSFKHNFPNTELNRVDISTLKGRDVERTIGGRVDGVFGGPPCQGFSSIGLRDKDDPRRQLLIDFFRIVAELKPAFFVMENVRGLAHSFSRGILDLALEKVVGRYDILGPVELDAAHYGAATKRKRLFVIGLDPSRCNQFSIEDLSLLCRPPVTVRDAIGDLKGAKRLSSAGDFDLWQIDKRRCSSEYAKKLRSRDGVFSGHMPTEHSQKVIGRFVNVQQGGMDKVGRHPRLSWSGQCPTLRAGTGNERGSYQSVRPIHPDEPRVITVREAARIQGFPDTFQFHPTIWHSFRMIGNSVSPIMSEAIFSAIATRLGMHRNIVEAAE